MKIAEFGSMPINYSKTEHYGNQKNKSLTSKVGFNSSFDDGVVAGINKKHDSVNTIITDKTSSAQPARSFQEYLMEAVNTVNNQQMDVSDLSEKLITSPDEVDVHDVTIAMSKARMSLNLAQTVIDRLVTDWNELSTNR